MRRARKARPSKENSLLVLNLKRKVLDFECGDWEPLVLSDDNSAH